MFFNILSWACFLVLAGVILGTAQEKFNEEYQRTSKLNEELKQKEAQLVSANRSASETMSQFRD
jgi:hypothetical protein